MPRRLALAALAATCLAGCAAPPAPTTARPMAAAQARAKMTGAAIFKRLDLSADGRLSLPEFRQLGIFGVNGRLWEPNPQPPLPEAQQATYESFDKNRDGAVSSAEFENFGVALQYALEFDTPSEFFTTLFPTLDLDHDDRLTLPEWEQMGIFGVHGEPDLTPPLGQLLASSFKRLDRDHDGFLTVAELTF